MAGWSVAPRQVASVLTATQACLDVAGEQLSGSAVVGGRLGVRSWEDRADDLAAGAGSDQIVAGAFEGFVADVLTDAGTALASCGQVLQATFAAASVLNGRIRCGVSLKKTPPPTSASASNPTTAANPKYPTASR